jgi:hypothetical protein
MISFITEIPPLQGLYIEVIRIWIRDDLSPMGNSKTLVDPQHQSDFLLIVKSTVYFYGSQVGSPWFSTKFLLSDQRKILRIAGFKTYQEER